MPFTAPIIDSTSVVNVVVGTFNLTQTAVAPARVRHDNSPVGPNDTNFTKVDLQNWTVASAAESYSGVARSSVATGSTDPIVLRTLTNGQPLQTTFKVLNLGFVYSVAVLF